jgi:hypothetical protein
VGKDTAKTEHFSCSVENIDHLSCLKKWNIPSKIEFANTVSFALTLFHSENNANHLAYGSVLFYHKGGYADEVKWQAIYFRGGLKVTMFFSVKHGRYFSFYLYLLAR